jgi:transcriptional regulator with XRE-family HTH domain
MGESDTDEDGSDPSEEGVPQLSTLEEVISGIGAKIRLMRTRRGLSLQHLANLADVSAAAIHKIERNGMVPTITTLMKLAAALNRPVSYFISEEAESDKPAVHTTPENRRSILTSIQGLELKAISGAYGRFFLAGAYAEADSGSESGRGPTSHPGEELVYLLEGELQFEFEDETVTLRPGESVHFRGDLPHRWENVTRKPAKAVWMALRPI